MLATVPNLRPGHPTIFWKGIKWIHVLEHPWFISNHVKPASSNSFLQSSHIYWTSYISRWNASWATVACMPISWRWFRSIPGLQIGKINLHPQQVPQHKLAESTWRLWQLWIRVTWFRIVLGQPNSILFDLYTLDVCFPDFTWPSIAWPLWRAAGCCDAFRYPTYSNEKLCLGKVARPRGRLELTSGFLGWNPLQINNDLELSIQRHAWKRSFKAETFLKLKKSKGLDIR